MAGIYIHIPFCKQACTYCNFHFSTSQKNIPAYLEALKREIEIQPFLKNNELIETVYFGGGTPSILAPVEIQEIINLITSHHNVYSKAEITMEANPDDINEINLERWKEANINRLSVGIQSFFETELQWMNRAHSVKQAVDCLGLIKKAGFENFSADLIYGSHLSNEEMLRKNLELMVSHKVPHLSCYALTRETKTAYDLQVKRKETPPENEEWQLRSFEIVCEMLQQNGYEQYEISNFALPGYRSKHNSSYWEGKPYLGLGPAAHSFNGREKRWWNIANNTLYIQQINKGIIPQELEILSEKDRCNEFIMIALRTAEGINLQKFENEFGRLSQEQLISNSSTFISEGKLELMYGHLKLTQHGKFFADGIAATLFQS